MTTLEQIRANRPTKYKTFFQKHGISTNNLARELGYSYAYLNDILNGDRNMHPHIESDLINLVLMIQRETGDSGADLA